MWYHIITAGTQNEPVEYSGRCQKGENHGRQNKKAC